MAVGFCDSTSIVDSSSATRACAVLKALQDKRVDKHTYKKKMFLSSQLLLFFSLAKEQTCSWRARLACASNMANNGACAALRACSAVRVACAHDPPRDNGDGATTVDINFFCFILKSKRLILLRGSRRPACIILCQNNLGILRFPATKLIKSRKNQTQELTIPLRGLEGLWLLARQSRTSRQRRNQNSREAGKEFL